MNLLLIFAEEANNSNIWIAVVTAISGIILAIVTGYFALKSNKDSLSKDKDIELQKIEIEKQKADIESLKSKLLSAKQEINLDSQALSFPKFLEKWNDIGASISRLFTRTKTTRFLILRAWNGYESPRYTTAIIQYRNSQIERSDYIHFELDNDYIERLLTMKSRKSLEMATKDLGNCAIGEIYRNENPPVTHSRWRFIDAEKIDENRQIITYCSFATDKDAEFTSFEKLEQDKIVNLIQQFLE